MHKFEIYTDGAYSSKRNQGGVGIVILRDNKLVQKYSKGYKNTTNNRMELIAVITALKAVQKPIDNLTIYSDSMYVIGCATLGWKRKKNQLLWKVFDETFEKAQSLVSTEIVFEHVKGHEGDKYNEMCDNLAVNASQYEG